MTRDQRTRLNIMISEQTGAASARPAPGKTTLDETIDLDEDAEHEAEQEQAPAPAERPRSVFDAPFAANLDKPRDD